MVCSTQQEGVFLVPGNPKHSPKSGYQVDISQGQCSCAYFTLKKIPCKHVCSIYPSLTEALYMTLDETIHSTVDRGVSYNRWQCCTLRCKWDTSPGPVEEPTQQIPVPTTTDLYCSSLTFRLHFKPLLHDWPLNLHVCDVDWFAVKTCALLVASCCWIGELNDHLSLL